MTRQEDTVHEITRRLVEFCHPLRIYLFGVRQAKLGNSRDLKGDHHVNYPSYM
jgi:hypothetical protein